MYEDENEDGEYGMDDLMEDMEKLRKAGIIEVSGINDDGQWLYSMTEFGKSLHDKFKDSDPDAFAETLEALMYINEEDDE